MSPIGPKAAHVRREVRKGQPRAHECHAKGCTTQVPPALLMCAKHWRMVPQALKNRIWDTYQPGQERGNVEPTDAYFEAQREAVEAVAKAEESKQSKQGRLPL
jgi:hypothetical protein